MPRRKQGHSRPSATGGYLKKKTDTGSEIIENESFTTSNDLVFKIKKTVSSTISNTAYHEKIEREHVDASKSLNDINMVSKYEVNNNTVELVKEQDENSNNRNVLENCCGPNFIASDTSSTEGLWNNRSSLLKVSVENNNSHVVSCDLNNTKCFAIAKELEKSGDDPSCKKSVVYSNNSDSAAVKVITTNGSASCRSLSNTSSSNCQATESQLVYKRSRDGLSDKQNSDFSTSKMSGVSPAVFANDRVGSKSDSQQMNYRVSTSITESRSNQAKDTVDSVVVKDEQNCELPSSVYGSPASRIEKVLTGLQVAEKSEGNESFGKISFLQEILQKKSSETVSYDSLSRQLSSSQKDELQNMDASDSSAKSTNSVIESKIQNNKSEGSQPVKLKLHIPEGFNNDDSNSSALSSESQKPAKIPKITSPQILEQHISKIISENAAIVETLDPKWSRRYFKQSSLNNSSIVETDLKKLSFPSKFNRPEDALTQTSNASEVSKLQSALLGGSELDASNLGQKIIVSPLKTSASNDKIPQPNNLSAAVTSVNVYSKIVCSVSEDELKGSAIKSLLSLRRGRYPKNKNSFYSDKDVHNNQQHPQNPEGSIIKDLLLKSKSKEGCKFPTEADDRINPSSFFLDGNNVFYKSSLLKCPNCSSEFSEKYSLDIHLSFCKSATKHLFSLRDDTERITFKQTNAQKLTDFQNHSDSHVTEDSNHSDAGIGPILKKQLLLPLSKSPPMKRRKVSDSILSTHYSEQSFGHVNHFNETSKAIPATLGSIGLLPHRSRSHSVHLFGGEVQIVDGDKTKRIKIKTSIPGAFTPINNKFTDSFVIKKPDFSEEFGNDRDAMNLPSVVVTIAQPVHNSGGTVHLPNRRSPSISPVVTIGSTLSDGIVKFAKSDKLSSDYLKNSPIELYKPFTQKEQPLLNFSNPSISLLRGPDSKSFYTTNSGLPISNSSVAKVDEFKPGSVVEEISPIAIRVPVSPGNKPFYSPIFSTEEKTFESAAPYIKEKESQNSRAVPTVVFTPSSPTLPTNDTDTQQEVSTTSISEPVKKFLAPTRPTSLPLKRKPFTMVGSTLISPETPRPKKSCVQLYLNGHAYTYLGLKCSTRSTYCCIYRPQPMFVLQETNPKLSMYSNWQVYPAIEELSGLTPGQMISLYCSKQRKEVQSVVATAKVGEPLIFTHSSYWTYRSTDHSGSKNSTPAETKPNQIEESKLPLEKNQDSLSTQSPTCSSGNILPENKSSDHQVHSADESSLQLDTDNATSDADEQIEKKKTQFSDGEDADDDDDDTDETDDECESDASSMIISNPNSRMLTNGHSKKSTSQDKAGAELTDENRGNESVSQQSEEQEAARSLLHLSAIGEPSQWSTSTGDLTDVASSGDADSASLVTRHDPTLLSPQYVTQTVAPVTLPNVRSKTVTDQWLSTEILGHRPRSYSADIPLGGGKELLTKYRLVKGIVSDTNEKASVDGSEFGSKDQYTRRYSISVAREARKPRVIPAPEWNALGLPTPSPKWPETESPDQPMDLRVSRDLGKYKSTYSGGTLLSVVTQEEPVPDRHLQTSLESCLNEQYQLKSLPVLSPQVVVDYDASVDSSSGETPLLSLTDDQTAFSSAGPTSRSVYYLQDMPPAENTAGRKEAETTEDPPSPDIDYSACSPVSPTTLDENSYYYSQENIGHSSSSNEEMQSSARAHAEFIVPSSSSSMEEGKCVCRICNKIFAKSSHLRLHVNIHYFERPFRCDNCAVSFRTKGHLQKHKRSVSHYNKVNMNLTFGTPTVDNPRPFKCADCKIAFRIHGHLAKHLRSKMHIMKLECLGKLPFGMYAEMERSGVSLNEIDTTDCNNSLESLQVMAQKLYQRDPRRMRWQGPDQSAVETECAMPAPSVTSTLLEPVLPISEPIPTAFDPSCSAIGLSLPSMATSKHLSESNDVKHEPSEVDSLRIPSAYTDGDSAICLSRYVMSQPITTANQETSQRVDVPESDSSVSLNRSGTCHMCGRLFKSAKFLQVHLYSDHSSLITSISDVPPSNSSVSSVASLEMNCDLCGKMFPNQKALQQHLLSHAQPRPFVCEICDAGFTSSSSLIAHQATHQTTSSQTSISETRLVQLK